MQQIQSAAEREAMAGAAWLGMVGVRAVAGEPTVALVAEPAGGAWDARADDGDRGADGDPADPAQRWRHPQRRRPPRHSTGQIAAQTRRVQVLVARTVQRVDVVVAGLQGQLGAARQLRQQSLRRRRASR
jgi:hypothetical protein